MEIRAYIEGIVGKWWLLLPMLALSLWIGNILASAQVEQYTASATVGINATMLANVADPANIVQLGVPISYQYRVAPQSTLKIVAKHYPRLSLATLQKNIVVTTDSTNQLLLINVTDIYPHSSVDIANYLAIKFVDTENANLRRQLDYYDNWLRQNIPLLTNEINKLDYAIQQLKPIRKFNVNGLLDPATRRAIYTDLYKQDLDERLLYRYQQALLSIEQTGPLFPKAYFILQPATEANTLLVSPLSPSLFLLLSGLVGFILAIGIIIALEYFMPLVRHKGELQRIVGLTVLAELPRVFEFEQKRLLQLRPLLFRWRMSALRLLCAAIGAPAIKDKGRIVLLTSPRKKRNLSAVLATFLAYSGHQTLLIDADVENPTLQNQIKRIGPSGIETETGIQLSFVFKTTLPNLSFLPATAMLNQNERLSSVPLVELLPELQKLYDIIIIDAPPLDHAVTHLLASKVSQTLLLVKKRRDSIKTLKVAHAQCQVLKLQAQSLLLT